MGHLIVLAGVAVCLSCGYIIGYRKAYKELAAKGREGDKDGKE